MGYDPRLVRWRELVSAPKRRGAVSRTCLAILTAQVRSMRSNRRILSSHATTLLAAALVASGLATAARAQRVLVVDGQNRPGTHFTDLPAAETAAQHGDVLDLRPDGGPYTAITTSKGLTILGNGSWIQLSLARTQPFRVSGLPAGRDFVLQRCQLHVHLQPPVPLMEVVQCRGRVHLQQLELASWGNAPALSVRDCTAVTLRESRLLAGVPALHAHSSTLALDGCRIVGATSPVAGIAGEAIRAEARTVLTLGGCSVNGGGATSHAMAPPAITMSQSIASIGGGKLLGVIIAGTYNGSLANATSPAIQGQASVVFIDPQVSVLAPPGVPRFVGVTVLQPELPALRATGRERVDIAFEGDPAAQHVTLIGLPGDPVFNAAFGGSLWLAPAPMIVLPGVLKGFATRTLPKGGTIALQVASLTSAGVELSNPIVATAP